MQRAMFAELASVIQVRLNLGGDDRVIDIGGNDGSFLDEFQEITRQLINCDPYAPRGTFHAVRKPWNLSTAKGFPEHRGRTLLTATNAWPHLPNQHDAMAGVAHALQRGGTLIVQMPWHRDLFNYHLYDTIYHEHLHYYGVAAFQRLCGAHGLVLFHVDYLPDVHGGTLRYWANATSPPDDSVDRLLGIEVETAIPHDEIASRAFRWREQVRHVLKQFPRLWAVGASAKAVMAMAMTATRPERIFDDTASKIGRICPGLGVIVESLSGVAGTWPDAILITAWNYKTILTERIRRLGYIGPVITMPAL